MSKADIDKQLDQMLSLGVTNIRVFVPWALIEPADNQYDWSHLQLVMDAAAARNMGVLAEINSTPLWAATSPGLGSILFPGADAPKPAAFVDFVKTFVSKYSTTVSAYEIWNEPNYIGFSNPVDPEGYTQLLKAVYPVIKGLDPTATVVAGALGAGQTAFGLTMSPVDYVQRMMAAGASGYFDALSIHPYNDQIPITGTCPTCAPGILTPRQQLDLIKDMIAGKKIWITEYGLATTPVASGATEADQAAWLKDLLDYWQTVGTQAGPVFLYNTRDVQADSTDPQNNYGLFYNDWDPKEAAAMLKAWIAAHLLPQQPAPQVLNPIAQFLAAMQQVFQSFSQAIASFFNPLSFVQSFFQAISNLFGFGAPAPAAVVSTSNLTTPAVPSAAKMASATAISADPESSIGAGTGTASESHDDATAATVEPQAAELEVKPVAAPTVAAEPEAAEPEAAQAESTPSPHAEPVTSVADETAPVAVAKAASSSSASDAEDSAPKTSTSSAAADTSEDADTTAAKPEKSSTTKTTSTTGASTTGASTTGASTTGASTASAGSDKDKPKAGSDSAGGSSSSGSSGSSDGNGSGD
jgi:hypothetical protein